MSRMLDDRLLNVVVKWYKNLRLEDSDCLPDSDGIFGDTSCSLCRVERWWTSCRVIRPRASDSGSSVQRSFVQKCQSMIQVHILCGKPVKFVNDVTDMAIFSPTGDSNRSGLAELLAVLYMSVDVSVLKNMISGGKRLLYSFFLTSRKTTLWCFNLAEIVWLAKDNDTWRIYHIA